MKADWQESLVKKQITYTLNLNDTIVLVENVSARINEETSEELSPPATVEHIQQTILDTKEPGYFVQVSIRHYSDDPA